MDIKFVNNSDNIKVEDFLKSNHVSNNLFIKLYKSNGIIVNDMVVGRNYRISKGDAVKIKFDDEENEYDPIDMKINVIFEDENILIVDKPPYITMHSEDQQSLANGISYLYSQNNIHTKIRFINRLDRDTSGLVVVAKNSWIQGFLQNNYNKIIKKYYAVVDSEILPVGKIDLKILREKDNIKSIVSESGKKCLTKYKLIKKQGEYGLIDVEIFSGRTHQIRVHLSNIGHPIIGDKLYGTDSKDIGRQCLHCYFLQIPDAFSDKSYSYYSRLPDDISKLISF